MMSYNVAVALQMYLRVQSSQLLIYQFSRPATEGQTPCLDTPVAATSLCLIEFCAQFMLL